MTSVRLQRLQLRNFKSFRKASIPFSDGFTAIAGANGSGKSNILDALLFVSGITSLKMLRAGKLTDLVNHDAEDGEARVDLIVEREMEGNKRTMELSRSIDRQGKSVYRIDQKRSTLNEVASLLQEFSIDPNGHNIVVQGDITRIIQMNPKERRQMLDDAAGIREFDEKKAESLKELDKVESKIKEVRIVLHEREIFLQKMEEERLIAQKYNELTRELKESKATLLQLDLTEQQGKVSELENREGVIANQLQEELGQKKLLDGEIKQLQGQWDEANNQLLLASGATFEGVGKLLQEKEADQKITQHDLTALNEREKELGKSHQLFLTDFEKASGKIPQLSEEVKQLREQLHVAEKEWEKAASAKATEHWRKALEEKNLREGEMAVLRRSAKMSGESADGYEVALKALNDAKKQLETAKKNWEKAVQQEAHEKWQHALQGKNHLVGQIAGIEKGIQKLQGLQKSCPTCEQELPKKYLDRVLAQRESEKKELHDRILALEKDIAQHHANWQEEKELEKKWHEWDRSVHHQHAIVEKEAARAESIRAAHEAAKRLETVEKELPHWEAEVVKWNREREAENALLDKKRHLENELQRRMVAFEQENDRVNRSKEQNQKETKERENIVTRKETLLKRQQELTEQIRQLRTQMEQELEKNKDLAEKKEVLKAKLHQQQEKRFKAEESIRAKEKQLNEIGIEKSKCLVRIQDVSEELAQYAQTPRRENETIARLRERIPKIERDITAMGAINMKALESFEQYHREIDEISGKVKKLEEERIAVLDLINNIGIKRQEAFMKCFVSVNEQFKEIYYTFFEGEGKLELLGEDNLDEAGLLIQARHKGEKLKSIDLMSGGEKTLTALAFLFAIQMYSPSPFYVFDEADAALDKENSLKLARMIRSIAESGQFIAITHNDALIKNAQQVVGVALNKQKSSVIGLKLEEVLPQHQAETA